MKDYHVRRFENQIPSKRRKALNFFLIFKIFKALIVLLIPILSGVAIWRGYNYVLAHPFFQIKTVFVQGNKEIPQEAILKSLELSPNSSLLAIDLATLRQKLRKNPWVKDASLHRRLPSSLIVKVMERTPVGLYLASKPYLVGEDGVILDSLSWGSLPDLPRVRGTNSRAFTSGEKISGEEFFQALEVWKRLSNQSPFPGGEVKEIALEGNGSLSLDFGSGMPRLRLRPRGLEDQIERLLRALAIENRSLEAYEYIDLRFQERVVLKPIKGR